MHSSKNIYNTNQPIKTGRNISILVIKYAVQSVTKVLFELILLNLRILEKDVKANRFQ